MQVRHHFGAAKVCELEMTVIIKQHVLGLEVAAGAQAELMHSTPQR